MTRSRNTPHGTLALLRRAILCLVALVLWSADGRAQVFAPMCDESGASAIAPLPVYVKDHGEIRQRPCSLSLLFDTVSRAPAERDGPLVNLEAPTRVIAFVAPDEWRIPEPALERSLDEGRCTNPSDDHPRHVYRPPR